MEKRAKLSEASVASEEDNIDMTNREKYLFSDFTLANYRRLIKIAKEQGFIFILHKDPYIAEQKAIIWRHDVEFSPAIAMRMAEIEADEGVKATYFWQLHTHYYNTVSPYFIDVLKKIHNLGHHLGLHFDSHFWNIQNIEELDQYISVDCRYLETIMNRNGIYEKIDTFSFHNTNPFILGCKEYQYGGLINVYSSYFREHYEYCGDSTGIWRYDRLEDKLIDPKVKHLQVLTHDGMWSEDAISPHARIMGCIQNEANRQKSFYAFGLPKTGNINVGEYSINPGIDEP